MTDEQIVRALECCLSSNDLIACWKCPAVKLNIYCDGNSKISNGIVNKVVDLIKRQQAEIERLQKESADKERAYTDEFCCRKEWQRKYYDEFIKGECN